jgi:hypothetical protein
MAPAGWEWRGQSHQSNPPQLDHRSWDATSYTKEVIGVHTARPMSPLIPCFALIIGNNVPLSGHKLRFLTIFGLVTIELDVFTQSLRIHPNELYRMDWTSRLSEPIALDNGEVLRNLSDAREFILALPEQHRAFAKWQRVAAKFDRADLTATATVELLRQKFAAEGRGGAEAKSRME